MTRERTQERGRMLSVPVGCALAPLQLLARLFAPPAPKRKRNLERVDYDCLTREELERLLGLDLEPEHKAILAILGKLGLRCNELRMLNVEDYDAERQRLKVRHAKGGKQRMLPTAHLDGVIDAWLAVREDVSDELGRPMFPTSTSPRISNRYLRTLIKRWGRMAGVAQEIPQGLHPHALRHTCLTLVYQATRDIRAAQELAGHSTPAVTAFYARVDMENKRQALAAAFGSAA